MKAFRYHKPTSLDGAGAAGAEKGAILKAGGIDLLARMKERTEEPASVVGLLELDDPVLRRIDTLEDGTLRIGSLATLSDVAASTVIREHLPALADACAGAASFQIRNRATLGGNLAQHTRCGYYRMRSFPCFKRGDFCPVIEDGAVQENAGIFDNGSCACGHPGSIPPVLGAAGAQIAVRSPRKGDAPGTTLHGFDTFYVPPKLGRTTDTMLRRGDVIVEVTVPPAAAPTAVAYEDVRQKAAFDWPLVSCGVRVTGDPATKKIVDAGVWLGSVAPRPHRAKGAEKALIGQVYSEALALAAAEAAADDADPLDGNRYKVDLVKVTVRRALEKAAGRWR